MVWLRFGVVPSGSCLEPSDNIANDSGGAGGGVAGFGSTQSKLPSRLSSTTAYSTEGLQQIPLFFWMCSSIRSLLPPGEHGI